jgi:hypothetical protein
VADKPAAGKPSLYRTRGGPDHHAAAHDPVRQEQIPVGSTDPTSDTTSSDSSRGTSPSLIMAREPSQPDPTTHLPPAVSDR